VWVHPEHKPDTVSGSLRKPAWYTRNGRAPRTASLRVT